MKSIMAMQFRHMPAKELTIDVTMGALNSIVVFHYDGYTLHYIRTLEILPHHVVRPTITIRMPSKPQLLDS